MKKIISTILSIASAVSVCNTCVNAQDVLPQMDTAISGEYEIREKQVIPQIGAKFLDLNVWGNALLRVFKDDTKLIQLSAEDTLSNGNYIELEENGVFDYYTVYSNIRELLFTAKAASEMGSIARGNVTDVTGIGGRPEDDTSILLTSTGADGSASVYSGYKNHEIGQITDNVWSYENTDGYLVFEAGIMPGDTTEFKLCTNGSRAFFEGSAVIPLTPGEWNKVCVVYDFENKLAKRIVNGEESEWLSATFGTNNYNVLRVLFEGAPGKTSAYLDDYKIYIANDVPTFKPAPELDDSVYRIEGSMFITDETLTADDIICDGAKVRVFTDKTYQTPVGEEEYLESGNIIVLTGADGSVTYYNVSTEADIELLSWWTLENTAVTGNDNVTAVTNAGGGKASDDDVLKYTGSTYIRLNTTNNLSSDKMLSAPLGDMTQYTGYMIVSMNVMSPEDEQKIRITTNQGNTIMGDRDKGGYLNVNADNGFMQNRWNNVVCVIALNNGSTESTQTTYINGAEFGTFKHNLFSSGKTDIRLNADGSGDVYFDDVKVKFTTEVPDMTAITAMPVLEDIDDKAYVDSGNYVISADVTVGGLSAGKATVKVFASDDFAEELGEEDIIVAGNIIVVTDSMGRTSYYTAA